MSVPVADGVTGWVRSEFTPQKEIARFPLGDSGHTPYPVTDPSKVSVTVREGIRGKRQPLNRGSWKVENKTELVLSRPAAPGQIYEVIYESAQPPIAGLGLTGIRDLISSLKTDTSRSLTHAIAFGTSQSAMLLRALVYEGFNADEKGKHVFDGIFAHVAGARLLTFHRFTQLSRTAGPLRNASFSTTDQFPFSDVAMTDRETGTKDGLLARALRSGTVPRIIHTNSSYEYWGSLGALLHTTLDGKADLSLPPTSRVYMLAGGQHGPAPFPPVRGGGQNLLNFNDYPWNLRALLGCLQAWVADDKAPPASEHPSLTARTLVPITAYSFPAIPNVVVPRSPYFSERLDFGASYRKLGLIDNEPPRLGKAFTTSIPQADRDGIDIAGVKMPWVSVPLGTFTGWNLRTPAIGMSTELLSQTGSYIAFSRTERERTESADLRLSIEERYRSETEYLSKIREAGMSLVQSGFFD